MWSLFRRMAIQHKEVVDRDEAVQRFLSHCTEEAIKLVQKLLPCISKLCKENDLDQTGDDILTREMISFRNGRYEPNETPLFLAHCCAIVTSKGIKSMYEFEKNYSLARGLESRIAQYITEREVGRSQVGRAPNPYRDDVTGKQMACVPAW